MLEFNKIYNMDCLEGMRQLPDGCIDLIATDPPYRIMPKGCSGTMSGYITTDKSMEGKIFDHNDIDIEDYIGEFYRLLKDDAHCYIMTNNYNICHFLEVIGRSKFHFTKCLIWDKQNKICGRYYMGQYEYIIFIRKGKDKQINDCGCSDIISIPNRKTKNVDGSNAHDSEKPVELMKTLVTNSTLEGEVVLDPFMGSGSTAVACATSGRKFIGFEIDEKYYKLANERLKPYVSENGGVFKERKCLF